MLVLLVSALKSNAVQLHSRLGTLPSAKVSFVGTIRSSAILQVPWDGLRRRTLTPLDPVIDRPRPSTIFKGSLNLGR